MVCWKEGHGPSAAQVLSIDGAKTDTGGCISPYRFCQYVNILAFEKSFRFLQMFPSKHEDHLLLSGKWL
jgi:hypothetical protein